MQSSESQSSESYSPFCEACLDGSEPGTPGSLSTNQGIGRMFHGRTATCAECGSAIRTAWSVFLLLPVIPRGSYRVIEFDEEAADGESRTEFLARRVPLHWPQVLRTWAVGAAAVLFLVWLAANRVR